MATLRSKVGKAKAAGAAPPAAKKATKAEEQSVKRKAAEDASPVSMKKRKAVDVPAVESVAGKKVTTTKKTTKKKGEAGKNDAEVATKNVRTKETKKVVKKSQAQEEQTGGDESDADETTTALVKDLEGSGGENDEDGGGSGGALLFQPGQDVGKAPVSAAVVAAAAAAAPSNKTGTPTKNKTGKLAKANGTVTTAAANGKNGNGGSDDAVTGGVVYIGRIPHGFFEHEMHSYFSQFGDIRRLRLSRNPRTGASKHYAFIEFTDRDVAAIVAQTMDNYLLFGHLLRCSVVAPDRIPPGLFKGANRRFKQVPWNSIAGRQLAQPKAAGDWDRKAGRESKRRAARAAQLKERLGYAYETPALKSAQGVLDQKATNTLKTTEKKALEMAALAEADASGEPEQPSKAIEATIGEAAGSQTTRTPTPVNAVKKAKGKKTKA